MSHKTYDISGNSITVSVEAFVEQAYLERHFSVISVQDRLRICRDNVADYGLPYFSVLLDGSADPLGFKDTKLGYELKRLFIRATGTREQ